MPVSLLVGDAETLGCIKVIQKMINYQLYMPAEDIGYALSVFENRDSNYISSFKIESLCHFLECIVLADKIIYDIGDEDDKYDNILEHFFSHFEISDLIIGEPAVQGFNDFFPDADPLLLAIYKFGQNYPDYDQSDLSTTLVTLDDFFKNYNLQNNINNFFHENKARVFDFLDFMTKKMYDFGEVSELLNLLNNIDNFSKLEKNELNAFATVHRLYSAVVMSSITTSILKDTTFFPSLHSSQFVLSQPMFAPSAQIFIDQITNKKYDEAIKLNDFLYKKYSLPVKIPLLANYIFSKAATIEELFHIALDIRSQKSVKNYRKRCASIDEALVEGHQEDAVRMVQEIVNHIKEIEKGKIVPIPTQFQLSFPPSIIFNLPKNMVNRRKQHLMFLNKIYFESKSPIIIRDKIEKLLKVEIFP